LRAVEIRSEALGRKSSLSIYSGIYIVDIDRRIVRFTMVGFEVGELTAVAAGAPTLTPAAEMARPVGRFRRVSLLSTSVLSTRQITVDMPMLHKQKVL